MDNLGNEVIIEVKAAIRAKLKEMNANNSDEIIDYIMLLVTTKKSNVELAKSINFLMESNTNIFVKWLSTIIKKLQQVTVSTTVNNMADLQVPEESKTVQNSQNGDASTHKISDKKSNDEDKEEFLLTLNVDDENLQIFDVEKKNNLPKLNVSTFVKYDTSKITTSSPDKLNKMKQNSSFSQIESIKTKNNSQLNKNDSIKKSFDEMKNTSNINKDFKVNSGVKQKFNDCDETLECKRKRPRISFNSDDEDEQNKNIRLKVPITTKESPKKITKQLQKKCNKIPMSQVFVVKNDTSKIKKNINMNDLTVPRVDHQRGALALDTAFKYIQQQIGVSDKEIAVVKKWRDYAVENLRSSKKI